MYIHKFKGQSGGLDIIHHNITDNKVEVDPTSQHLQNAQLCITTTNQVRKMASLHQDTCNIDDSNRGHQEYHQNTSGESNCLLLQLQE